MLFFMPRGVDFDRETERVAEAWFGNLVEDQISILRLPTKKGGLGFTACAPTRGAAYESCWDLSLLTLLYFYT